ncbi:MAG: hypothetical protein AAGC68_07060, partial [Verrucomicrobiota bacterium]
FLSAKKNQSRHLLTAADALFEHPNATTEDRLQVLELSLEIGDLVKSRTRLLSLTQEELKQPDAMSLAVRFFLHRNDHRRALALVNELQEARGSLEDQLLAATVLAKTPSEKDKALLRAQDLIRALFMQDENTRIALSAFSLLRTIPKPLWQCSKFEDTGSRLETLQENGAVLPLSITLLGLEIEKRIKPGNTDRILDEAIAKYTESNRFNLCEWLLLIEEAERAITLLEGSGESQSPRHYSLLVRAHILKQDWAKAASLLAQPNPRVDPTLVSSLHALVYGKQGRLANSERHWERAFDHASMSGGRQALLDLAQFAAKSGNEEIRNRALTEALKRRSPVALPAKDVSFLFTHLASSDRAEDLLVISRSLLRGEPDNPILLNNVVWLELLLRGRSSGTLVSRVAEIAEKHPEITTLQSTLTLAYLLSGHEDLAHESFGRLSQSSPNSFTESDRAVLAYAKKQLGENSEEAVELIQWEDLMQVEVDFFRPALSEDTSIDLADGSSTEP